jgi:tetratricopeptide (TPR) repeat protein
MVGFKLSACIISALVALSLPMAMATNANSPSPESVSSLLNKGYAAIGKGNFESAISILTQAVKADPNSVGARRYLAYALTSNGDSATALDQMKIVKKMAVLTAFDHVIFGEAYYSSSKYRESEDSFAEALKIDPTSELGRAGIIKSFTATAQWDKAIKACREGMRLAKSKRERDYFQALAERVNKARLEPPALANGEPMQATGAIIALPPNMRNKNSAE